jgi:hypothetical protein
LAGAVGRVDSGFCGSLIRVGHVGIHGFVLFKNRAEIYLLQCTITE